VKGEEEGRVPLYCHPCFNTNIGGRRSVALLSRLNYTLRAQFFTTCTKWVIISDSECWQMFLTAHMIFRACSLYIFLESKIMSLFTPCMSYRKQFISQYRQRHLLLNLKINHILWFKHEKTRFHPWDACLWMHLNSCLRNIWAFFIDRHSALYLHKAELHSLVNHGQWACVLKTSFPWYENEMQLLQTTIMYQ
jgi:hypothetical protein